MTFDDPRGVNSGQDWDEAVDTLVAQLGYLTARLRQTSQVLLLSFAVNLLASIGVTIWAALTRADEYPVIDFRVFAVFPPLLLLPLFALLVRFESLRRRAAALFEELSDEFQWFIAGRGAPQNVGAELRPPLAIRVALREGLQAQDLPFFAGRNGPAQFGVLSIAVTLICVFIILS